MAKRLVKSTVQIHRDGKIFQPRIGDVEDFSKEEIEAVNKLNPKALVPVEIKDVVEPPKVEAAAASKKA